MDKIKLLQICFKKKIFLKPIEKEKFYKDLDYANMLMNNLDENLIIKFCYYISSEDNIIRETNEIQKKTETNKVKEFHDILFDNDEFIYINHAKIIYSIENYFDLYYLINKNSLLNYKYNIEFIININEKNKIEEKKLKKLIVSKILLVIIKNFLEDDDISLSDSVKAKAIEQENNQIAINSEILKDYNYPNSDNEQSKVRELQKIYNNIIIYLIQNRKFEKFKYTSEILNQLDLENINVGKEVINFIINNINKDYIDYLDKIDPKNVAGITYDYGTNLLIVRKDYKGNYSMMNTSTMSGNSSLTLLPTNPNNGEYGVIDDMYDVIAGELDPTTPGLILQVDARNQLFGSTLEQLGFKKTENISFNKILGKELHLVFNDDYYLDMDGRFIPNQDYESLYNSDNSYTVKVQAIIRGTKEQELVTDGSGLLYNQALADLVMEHNSNSRIVEAQLNADYNILTTSLFDETVTKDAMLGYLGYKSIPTSIYIYPNSFEGKEKINEYLDKYNEGKKDKDQVKYTDMAAMISSLSSNIMDAITIVLLAFSSISLIVSSIMIGIITYISVLERTKEIGILRSLGARAKDIKRVFIAETFIIGLSSGILGVLIARLLIIPINHVIYDLTTLSGVAKMDIKHITILLIVSTALTIIGGYIPAKIASKKNPVDSLRSE